MSVFVGNRFTAVNAVKVARETPDTTTLQFQCQMLTDWRINLLGPPSLYFVASALIISVDWRDVESVDAKGASLRGGI